MQLKLELRDGKLRSVVLEGEDSPQRNPYVETLQNCLAALGYDVGTIDGKFGRSRKDRPSKTTEAVKKFQKDNLEFGH
jgi:peptidoglycan hydrolase-like protein with peptidoglycan-binding domain